jgi:hypothetical protein
VWKRGTHASTQNAKSHFSDTLFSSYQLLLLYLNCKTYGDQSHFGGKETHHRSGSLTLACLYEALVTDATDRRNMNAFCLILVGRQQPKK